MVVLFSRIYFYPAVFSPNDISNARQSPTRNIVYFKANQTLYEYNGSQSKIKEMPIKASDDILKQMGLK